MILELFLFMLAGIGIGIFAGLTPGIHVNTLIPLLLTLLAFFPNPYYLAVLIIAVSITEMFIDFIPSIFIGAPDPDVCLSVLPGHRMLLEGRGYEAIKLTVLGGLGGLLLSLVVIGISANAFKFLYEISRPYVHYFIILVILFMIFSERKPKKMLFTAFIIILSGIFGMIILNSSLINQQNVLFPSLTGLFGLSTLIISISEKARIPEQKEDSKIQLSKKNIIKSMILGSLAGIIVGFLPAIGISQAAVMTQYLGGMGETRSFLVSLSGINIANDAFSLISLFLVGNPRSGASVAIQRILSELTVYDILLFIGVILLTAGIASLISLYLGKKIPKYLEKIDYKKLSLAIIIFITCLIFALTGIYGLLIAFTSTSIGILCNHLGVRRSNCMGILLIPTIFFFAGLNPKILEILGV